MKFKLSWSDHAKFLEKTIKLRFLHDVGRGTAGYYFRKRDGTALGYMDYDSYQHSGSHEHYCAVILI